MSDPNKSSGIASVFFELRRRNVVRVAAAYLVFGWVILQVMEVVAPLLAITDTAQRVVLALLAIGFVPALAFSWFYQLTPEGLKRESDLSAEQSAAGRKARRMEYLTLVGAMALVALLLMRLQTAEEVDVQTPLPASVFNQAYDPPPNSIAVLPFTNMSGNPDNEYFSDGLADTVLHRLAQLDQLFVTARTSSFQFREAGADVRAIGRKLNVGTILEGSVQQVGDQMRIIAQLIDCNDGKHLWSLTFDTTTEDLFAVQDEISLKVAEALEIELLREVEDSLTDSGTKSPEAHDLFALGRYHAEKLTSEGVREAHGYFLQAVEIDPAFVNAWVGIAEALLHSPQFEHWPGTLMVETINAFVEKSFPELTEQERYAQAREAIEIALGLDEGSAAAWAAMGRLETWLGDPGAAEAALQRAIELQPNFAAAHYYLARFLSHQFRYGEATRHFETALKLDPVNILVIYWTLAQVRMLSDGRERTDDLIRRIVELDPDYAVGRNIRTPTMYQTFALFMAEIGKVDQAVEWLETELEFVPDRSTNIMQIAHYYALLGDRESAIRWRDHARQLPNIYDDRNAIFFDWYTSIISDPAESYAFVERTFGNADIPYIWGFKGSSAGAMGDVELALENFDRLPGHEAGDALFSQEALLSQYIPWAVPYTQLLTVAGRMEEAKYYLEQSIAIVDSLRQQGWVSSNLDMVDAYVAVFQGQNDAAIMALKAAINKGELYSLFPLDPTFTALHEDPRYQVLVERFNARNAEQLELLRKRHAEPPPWSPDYQVTE